MNSSPSTEIAFSFFIFFSMVYFYFHMRDGNSSLLLFNICSPVQLKINVKFMFILKTFDKFSFKIFSFRKILSLADIVSIKNNILSFRVIAFIV